MRQRHRAPHAVAVHRLDAVERACREEAQHRVVLVRRAVRQAQPQRGRGRALGLVVALEARAPQLAGIHAIAPGERGVEAAQAGKAAGQRHLGHRHRGVGQQMLGQQQALGRQVVDRCDAHVLLKNAAQVTIGDAQPRGQPRHRQRVAVVRRLFDRARGLLRQRLRRVHQRQAGCELGAATQARPETVGLGQRRVAEEAAVLAPRQPHAAHRTAVHARGRHADEQPAVEAGIVRADRAVGSVVMQGHGRMIGGLPARTRRFRTHA
jgi:hypothetical protein